MIWWGTEPVRLNYRINSSPAVLVTWVDGHDLGVLSEFKLLGAVLDMTIVEDDTNIDVTNHRSRRRHGRHVRVVVTAKALQLNLISQKSILIRRDITRV